MTGAAVASDWAAIEEIPAEKLTAGQKLYLHHGFPGIRGEVAAGLPGVMENALPAFRDGLKKGRSRNDAGSVALLHLIARDTDTNMMARGGVELAHEAAEKAAGLLKTKPLPDMADIAALDDWFIQKNLSPGGCADLLAVTYFLHDWAESEQ